jgi:hypothetical protein
VTTTSVPIESIRLRPVVTTHSPDSMVPAVTHQVGVRVDPPRQQARVPVIVNRDIGRDREAEGFDSGDAPPIH